MKTALILVGHGSHISPQTAGLVWRHVDRLRAMGIADEITAAFWKEMPSFALVMNTITADDVTVIPLFTARGYFTQTVIPTEMGLNRAVTERDGRIIRYTPSLHEHPYLAAVVRIRVEDTLRTFALNPSETAVAIIGHSTRRNPDSRKATEAHAQRLRDAAIVAEVQAVYLDDLPEIPEIYKLINAPNLIAVPYFLAAGSHSTIDVPNQLGLSAGATRDEIHGRQVFYTAPVGVDDDLLNVILALARDSGAALKAPAEPLDSWQGFPLAGSAALIAAVQAAGKMRFGDLGLSLDKVQVWGDDHATDEIDSPASLRARVRENPFRSLTTSDDLPRGWYVRITQPAQLHAVVETIYPGAVADWAAAQAETLQINPITAVVARQTGIYRALDSLSHEAQAQIVGEVCAGCVRSPVWYDATLQAGLPCPEACNHWLSAALEQVQNPS